MAPLRTTLVVAVLLSAPAAAAPRVLPGVEGAVSLGAVNAAVVEASVLVRVAGALHASAALGTGARLGDAGDGARSDESLIGGRLGALYLRGDRGRLGLGAALGYQRYAGTEEDGLVSDEPYAVRDRSVFGELRGLASYRVAGPVALELALALRYHHSTIGAGNDAGLGAGLGIRIDLE